MPVVLQKEQQKALLMEMPVVLQKEQQKALLMEML
jgi:hypothetical protein